MVVAVPLVPAAGDDPAALHHDSTDHGVRAGPAPGLFGKLQRQGHVFFVDLSCHKSGLLSCFAVPIIYCSSSLLGSATPPRLGEIPSTQPCRQHGGKAQDVEPCPNAA